MMSGLKTKHPDGDQNPEVRDQQEKMEEILRTFRSEGPEDKMAISKKLRERIPQAFNNSEYDKLKAQRV